ncbi:enoyl-CoA hydratase/isomerase family protein [Cupriavidus sp. UYPR2.512]|uniref:enoyl-CoA hydratase/isomerase family protein n=1 Tax=Cupriavidus sp. UYPR2.512 TaxID=1080187 RepID=UPI00036BDBC5|nr:enoyl-CoA hydratase/isomerase family protein [Cupriavidus sp. UYPR2.512]
MLTTMETLSQFRYLVVRRLHGVLFITLNQPESRNALSPELLAEITQVLDMAEQDSHARALVLRGAGAMFCAGGNIGGFRESLAAAAGSEDPIATRNRQFGHLMKRLASLPVPVLAVVEGAAMGGGVGLVCAADLVLATHAARFALSETTLGVIAAQIAPFVVARIGAAATRRLGLSGERISGTAAVAIGLADALAGDSEGLDALEAEWLTRIGRCAPGANRAFKSLVARCTSEPAAPLLDDAARLFAQCLRHEGAEGTSAFRERRDAHWCVRFDADMVRGAHAVPAASSPAADPAKDSASQAAPRSDASDRVRTLEVDR